MKTDAAKRLAGAAVIAAASLYGMGREASANELRYAIAMSPTSFVTQAVEDTYAPAVLKESGGDLSIKIYAMTLLSWAEKSAGLRDGIADVALVLTPYFPNEYQTVNFVGDLNSLIALGGTAEWGSLAWNAAVTEFQMLGCPECIAEYAAQNAVFTGGNSTALYSMMCREKVTTLDEMKGKRIRTSTGKMRRFAEAMGAVPVQITAGEMYQAMSQGVVDCAPLAPAELANYALTELVKHVTLDFPGDLFAGSQIANVNMDVWNGLDTDQRLAMLKAGAALSSAVTYRYVAASEKSLEEAKAAGAVISAPADDLLNASREFVASDLDVAVRDAVAAGITRAPEIRAELEKLYEKWSGLLAGMSSEEEYRDLVWNHIYSQIDPSAYPAR